MVNYIISIEKGVCVWVMEWSCHNDNMGKGRKRQGLWHPYLFFQERWWIDQRLAFHVRNMGIWRPKTPRLFSLKLMENVLDIRITQEDFLLGRRVIMHGFHMVSRASITIQGILTYTFLQVFIKLCILLMGWDGSMSRWRRWDMRWLGNMKWKWLWHMRWKSLTRGVGLWGSSLSSPKLFPSLHGTMGFTFHTRNTNEDSNKQYEIK